MKKRDKDVKFRHRIVEKVFKALLYPVIKIKYRYKYKVHKELKNKGPYIIISNHTVAMDPILMSFTFPFNIYYLASEQIFNLGLLSKLLVYLVNPISKSKALSDISAIRKSKKIVKEGGSIGVYPEGNVTYDGASVTINDSIVKLIRLLEIDVIIFNTQGLYLSDPRWSVFRKKGKSSGFINKIIKKEEYKDLTNEELYEVINEGLNVNAYDQQAKELVKYRGKNLAVGLERLVFMDLKTNKPFVTYSQKNELKSRDSDFKLKYDEYGYLVNEAGVKKTLVEVNKEVIDSYFNFYQTTNENLLFEERANVEITTKKRKSSKGLNYIRLYKNKIIIEYDNNLEEFMYEDVTSISIQGKRKIIINSSDKTLLITFNLNSSPYKYLLTYQFYIKEKNDDTSSIQQFGL